MSYSRKSASITDLWPANRSNSPAKIRIGEAYQAPIPSLIEDRSSAEADNDHSSLVWAPEQNTVPESDLLEYLRVSNSFHEINEEQALGILAACRYNLEVAREMVTQVQPIRDGNLQNHDKSHFERSIYKENKLNSMKCFFSEMNVNDLFRYYYNDKTFGKKSFIEQLLLPENSDEESQDIFKFFLNSCNVEKETDDLIHRDDYIFDPPLLQKLFAAVVENKDGDMEQLPFMMELQQDIFKKRNQLQYQKMHILNKLNDLREQSRYFEMYHDKTIELKNMPTPKWTRIELILLAESLRRHKEENEKNKSDTPINWEAIAKFMTTKEKDDIIGFYERHHEFVDILARPDVSDHTKYVFMRQYIESRVNGEEVSPLSVAEQFAAVQMALAGLEEDEPVPEARPSSEDKALEALVSELKATSLEPVAPGASTSTAPTTGNEILEEEDSEEVSGNDLVIDEGDSSHEETELGRTTDSHFESFNQELLMNRFEPIDSPDSLSSLDLKSAHQVDTAPFENLTPPCMKMENGATNVTAARDLTFHRRIAPNALEGEGATTEFLLDNCKFPADPPSAHSNAAQKYSKVAANSANSVGPVSGEKAGGQRSQANGTPTKGDTDHNYHQTPPKVVKKPNIQWLTSNGQIQKIHYVTQPNGDGAQQASPDGEKAHSAMTSCSGESKASAQSTSNKLTHKLMIESLSRSLGYMPHLGSLSDVREDAERFEEHLSKEVIAYHAKAARLKKDNYKPPLRRRRPK